MLRQTQKPCKSYLNKRLFKGLSVNFEFIYQFLFLFFHISTFLHFHILLQYSRIVFTGPFALKLEEDLEHKNDIQIFFSLFPLCLFTIYFSVSYYLWNTGV